MISLDHSIAITLALMDYLATGDPLALHRSGLVRTRQKRMLGLDE